MASDLYEPKGNDSIVLRVHVHPGAGRTSVVGRHGDALKVRVAAPPSGGRANEACSELVAGILGLKASAVEVTSGQTSRQKQLTVAGIEPDEAGRLLDEALQAAGSRPGQRPLDGRQ